MLLFLLVYLLFYFDSTFQAALFGGPFWSISPKKEEFGRLLNEPKRQELTRSLRPMRL